MMEDITAQAEAPAQRGEHFSDRRVARIDPNRIRRRDARHAPVRAKARCPDPQDRKMKIAANFVAQQRI